MLTEKQIKARSQGIGGSDAGTLLGLNPHKTAVELWLEKTGRMPIDNTDNPAQEWGRRLEAVVAHATAEKLDIRIRRGGPILVQGCRCCR